MTTAPEVTAAGPSRRAKILRRTKVGAALAVTVAAALYAASFPFGPLLVLGLGVALASWCGVELERMGLLPARSGAAGAALASATAAWGFQRYGVAAVSLVASVAAAGFLGVGVAAVGGRGPGRLALALRGVPVAAFPLLFLHPVRIGAGASGLAALVALAKIGDIAGYYFGNLLGRTHPFPRLSPGKTTEGCLASLLAGTASGVLFAELGAFGGPRQGLVSGLLLGAGVNLAAQAGDLFESALKRRAGVKDSGTTFGPSGGMLDLVDSFLFAAPLAAFVGPVLFHWGP